MSERKQTSKSIASRSIRLPVLAQQGRTAHAGDEFRPGAEELAVEPGPSRRSFMSILGASTAVAGMASTGCIRKPREYIVPFARRPEDVIPGEPLQYATALQVGSSVLGVLVECHDGRPTKVEGNPKHPNSMGSTDVWAQATLLELYDPDRSKTPRTFMHQAHYVFDERDPHAKNTEEFVRQTTREALCRLTHERVLASTKSVDRARAAEEACRNREASEGAAWDVRKVEGKWQASLSVPGDEQVESDWNSAWQSVQGLVGEWSATKGKGVAVVVPDVLSPTWRDELRHLAERLPEAKLVLCDPAAPVSSYEFVRMLGVDGGRVSYDLSSAAIVVAADSDFLGKETDHVRLARQFLRNRKVETEDADTLGERQLARLYAIEGHPTITGIAADERLRCKSAHVVDILSALAIELIDTHGVLDAPRKGEDGKTEYDLGGLLDPAYQALAQSLRAPEFDPGTTAFIKRLAADLAALTAVDHEQRAGKTDRKTRTRHAVVIVGDRQPPAVHALGMFINGMLRAPRPLGDVDTRFVHPAVRISKDIDALSVAPLSSLAQGLDDGSIEHVICLGTNPAYEAPAALGLAKSLAEKAKTLIHCGLHLDETARLATWHLPVSHAFEAWGDLVSVTGVFSICQPLIAPLYDTPSLIEITARLADPSITVGSYDLVRRYWETQGAPGRGLSQMMFEQSLHDGVLSAPSRGAERPEVYAGEALVKAYRERPRNDDQVEVQFHLDSHAFGGRFANNPWMQECPDPVSKLVWDNAAYISPAMAKNLGVKNGEFVAIKTAHGTLAAPAWIIPGQAEQVVAVTLGMGRRELGRVADGAGVDAFALQDPASPGFTPCAISKGAGTYQLVSTQDYGSLDPDGPEGTPLGINFEERPLYREATLAEFKADPDFAQRGDLMPATRLHSLFENPELTALQQWGLVIDLNSCIGCNACVVACQAENNIPCVGKKEVSNGRELHWIRIDRYYRGDENDPHTVFQPVVCMHCEHAPCETVCPVAATPHSPEGLNDMAYNRCIGTRYCSNNCPYKVRRYNYFNYNYPLEPIEMMQKNPDVTVRFRGVMEKCSYCVQRINGAKIEAHVRGEDLVADGAIVTACQQVCPGDAITFGDIADESSKVAKLKASRRNYAMLSDLKTLPRTTYLGRITNPNAGSGSTEA